MKFPFYRFLSEPCSAFPKINALYRPVIPIHIYSPDLKYKFRHYALLDTGADYNLFHGDLLSILNMDYLDEGKREDMFGIEGRGVPTYFHDVVIEVGSWRYKTPTAFTNYGMVSTPDQITYGILGQVGFFNHFKVTFDYDNEQIDIKPINKK